jgi:ABC-type branched-subunit amino acid transport system substrate-binding protein
MRYRNKWFRLLALLFALSLVAAACGRDDDDDGGAAEDEGGTGGEGEEAGPPPEVPGFDGTTISVGVVTPQTGGVEIIGDPLTNGNRVYFEYVNEELGGIAGQYPIEMEIVDSQYDATVAVQQYNAIKENVVMFAQLLGTPTVNAVLEQLVRDNIVAAPASLDSFWVREQQLLPIGAPYQIQAINGLSWYLEEGGGDTSQTICAAIHDDPYGEAGLEGVEFAAGELGFELATTVRFAATSTEFSAPLGELQAAGCEVVWLTATPTTAGGLLGTAAAAQYAPQWLAQSPTWLSLFAQGDLAPYLQANYLLVGEGTTWGDMSQPGMAQMIEHQEAYAPDQQPDIYFVFGYAQAQAVTQVLERAVENGDLSRDGIVEAMNSIEVLEFGGLFGDYPYGPPEDRDPPRTNTIYRVDPATPGGLAAEVTEVESAAAGEFQFAGG